MGEIVADALSRLDDVSATVEDSADMIGFSLIYGAVHTTAHLNRAWRVLVGLPADYDGGFIDWEITPLPDMPGVNDRFYSRESHSSVESSRWFNTWARRWTRMETETVGEPRA
ncbi:hypothetical protein F8O07_06720 [Pseudoclavibacter sp. CFCC 13796]|uniref:hypothetical protein n=1 Tax=Pseudoclavibacter sp. CFCC 13796 TaxID=2615179 RepID=UPI0013016E8F|nr:hypothetical protein [Pseudoclavibacter sp. CFCC 13796]KAB1661592.1 hypothetical protein F8O07_06720 [Pseudoclavibacter sp. CFCC 13796]